MRRLRTNSIQNNYAKAANRSCHGRTRIAQLPSAIRIQALRPSERWSNSCKAKAIDAGGVRAFFLFRNNNALPWLWSRSAPNRSADTGILSGP